MTTRTEDLEAVWALTNVELIVVGQLARALRGVPVRNVIAWSHLISAAADLDSSDIRLLCSKADHLRFVRDNPDGPQEEPSADFGEPDVNATPRRPSARGRSRRRP